MSLLFLLFISGIPDSYVLFSNECKIVFDPFDGGSYVLFSNECNFF